MTDARKVPTKAMIDRFLSWRLPEYFRPDCGISFDGRGKDAHGFDKGWPVGTNLLTADQAKEMLAYVMDAAPPAREWSDADCFAAIEPILGDKVTDVELDIFRAGLAAGAAPAAEPEWTPGACAVCDMYVAHECPEQPQQPTPECPWCSRIPVDGKCCPVAELNKPAAEPVICRCRTCGAPCSEYGYCIQHIAAAVKAAKPAAEPAPDQSAARSRVVDEAIDTWNEAKNEFANAAKRIGTDQSAAREAVVSTQGSDKPGTRTPGSPSEAADPAPDQSDTGPMERLDLLFVSAVWEKAKARGIAAISHPDGWVLTATVALVSAQEKSKRDDALIYKETEATYNAIKRAERAETSLKQSQEDCRMLHSIVDWKPK